MIKYCVLCITISMWKLNIPHNHTNTINMEMGWRRRHSIWSKSLKINVSTFKISMKNSLKYIALKWLFSIFHLKWTRAVNGILQNFKYFGKENSLNLNDTFKKGMASALLSAFYEYCEQFVTTLESTNSQVFVWILTVKRKVWNWTQFIARLIPCFQPSVLDRNFILSKYILVLLVLL